MSTKDKIKRFLAGTKEATAKQIAAGIKMQNTPSELANALNEMRTLGIVECEKKKGKGNEYWYWLTEADPAAAEPEAAQTTTAEVAPKPAAPEAKGRAEKNLSGAMQELADMRVEVERLTSLRDAAEERERATQRQLQQARADERTAMSWLADVKKAANHSGDLPTLVARVRALSQIEKAGSSDDDELRAQLQAAREANDAWLALAGEHECKSLADMRVYVDALLRRIETLKPAKPAGDHQPRRPFSVTGLSGYHTAPGKVTLFLDRRLSARSITLEAGKLQQLADMAREG